MADFVSTFFRELNEKESSKETRLTYRQFLKTVVQFLCYLFDMENCNEFLYFDGHKAPIYYLCGYIPESKYSDPQSRKLLDFKFGSFEAKQYWLDQFLISYEHLFDKDESELIIRSLSHHEIYIDPNTDYKNPLGYLCYRISKTVHCRYAPGMLHKNNYTPTLKGLKKNERWDTVKDNFGLSQLFMPGSFKTVWFIDDIITTGATARATWKALLDFYPDIDFKVIALARTVREHDFNSRKDDRAWSNILRENEEYYKSNLSKHHLEEIKFDNSDTFFI